MSLRMYRLMGMLALTCAGFGLVPEAEAARPPITWLKGEGNYTKSHRAPASIDRIVVHVTEGSFWGSVRWLQSPRAHASSHFIVSRGGKIVQLVHISDIAWHAGNWETNVRSVGIEHEGFTYGPHGFTDAQYESSARLAGWLARRSLLPIDRKHVIGHHEVPDGGGGRGGASHHTDPGPRWNWKRYLRLVRRYAGVVRLSVKALVPRGSLRGIVSLRAKASGDIKRVEFLLDGRVVHVDRRAPFAYRLNTTRLANRAHRLQVHGIAGPGRYDIEGETIVVDNKTFALTSAGARPWSKTRGAVRLRVRPWGARAAKMVFTVDAKRRAVDRRPPFLFTWSAKRAKPGKHVLQVVATSIDGRTATQRIPLVVPRPPAKPKPPAPQPPKPRPAPLEVVSRSLVEGQQVDGLVVWRVEATGRPLRVQFLVDGAPRATDVAAPYTFGWNTEAEPPGQHRLTARALRSDGRTAEASVMVTVPERPDAAGNGAP